MNLMSAGAPDADYFRDSTVVITGGASGIGKATAELFSAAHADVVISDLDEQALELADRGIENCTAIRGDVSRWDDCLRLAAAVQAAGKPLRVIVNAAASFLAKGVDATPDDWDRCLAVNVKGTALVTTALVGLMRSAGKGGAIVNIASVSGYIAQPDRWTYNATKGAILALTRCQALDLAPDNIRVNSVSPGTIWTPELDRMTGHNRAEWGPLLGSHHMLNRVGEPAEVASAVLFLCGPGAGFITGADLLVDGGYVAMGHDRFTARPEWSSS